MRRARTLLTGTVLLVLGCGGPRIPESPLSVVQRSAAASRDGELVGRWLLSELVLPGGTPRGARKARAHLDELSAKGTLASLGRGLDDALHGRLEAAGNHYLEAASSARNTEDSLSPLYAWFAINRALGTGFRERLWQRWKPKVLAWMEDPKAIGWRARSELAEWAMDQAWAAGEPNVDARAIEAYGCLSKARIAGPFGRGAPADAIRSFPPERPGPWPERWERTDEDRRLPRVFDIDSKTCALQTDERQPLGVFYAESFFELPNDRDVLLAGQGALALLVDDAIVLQRDVRVFGVWPKFGVRLRLKAGRHRVVARLTEASTSIRLLRPDGTPLGAKADRDDTLPYASNPPEILGDPNVLSAFTDPPMPTELDDGVTRYLAAGLAHIESSDDVAAVLVEPLVSDVAKATGPALSAAATYSENDPVFQASQAKDIARALREQAVKRDPGLWGPRLSLSAFIAEKKGGEEAVPAMEQARRDFPDVPEVGLGLSRLYGELGWVTEHEAAVKELARRFPDDLGVLHAAVDVYEGAGDTKTVDALLARISRLDKNDEIHFGRALAREDYDAAIAELSRLLRAHPEKDELEQRIADVKARAGRLEAVEERLKRAVAEEPKNSRARLDLADYRFAAGDKDALRRSLAEAVAAGASPALVSDAIDLVESATELSPYRLDGREIIRAYERGDRKMPGTAARILDYAALWVRSDGSSRMLEHEIIRLQSAEGIKAFSEHRMLDGLVLHLRVLKQDGTVFEPELVAGKPTVTFPHLEVGDYIETEQIVSTAGDGVGATYNGPRWFFREENVGYARSEFVVITPADKNLVVETTGEVPAPRIETRDGLISRRYRVDFSPAAASEPGSAPASEFLPSVRLGWGVSLPSRLRDLSDAMIPMIPVDPRVARIAERLVRGVPSKRPRERAVRLYRWLVDNVEPADESDGRRVILGKRGNPWQGFRTLCRAVGVDVRYAVAESRLAAPAAGPLSLATHYTHPVAWVADGKEGVWLTLGNKFAPFGYLPAEVRGMPAFWLDGTGGRVVLPTAGDADRIAFTGKGSLDATGTLTIDLTEEFSGKLAAAVRQGLAQVPEKQLPTVLESNLLAQAFRGGELVRHSIERREDRDRPLVVRMTAKVRRFAQLTPSGLVIVPPLSPDLGRLATLPSRKNPLLISEGVHRKVALTIGLPKGVRADVASKTELVSGERRVVIADSISRGALVLDRTVELPAGRVQPKEYADFARFARTADDALSRAIRVTR